MTGSSPKFPNCDRYQPSGLSLGQELPNNAYISGKIVLLWSMKAGAYQLRFSISAKYQTNVTNSDYVSTSDKGTEKWKFNISLNPLAGNIKSGQTIQQTVEAEHEAMLPYLASEIKIATDGLKVIKIDGKDVGLEGIGSRMMWTESRGTWTVFQEPTQSSNTPSWLDSDLSLPSPSGPPARTVPQAGPSNYRPISSHAPPQLNLRPTNSPIKRKRTLSPEKTAVEPAAKQSAPSIRKKVIEVGSGRTPTFSRELGGFKDLAILRGTSSIGDALAGSSSSIGVTEGSPEKQDQHRSTPVSISTDQAKSIAGSQRAARVNRNPVAAVIPRMEEDQPARIISARAKAEDAARQEGARRLEQQEAEQRAVADAAAALGRGLAVANIEYTPLKELRMHSKSNIIGVVVKGGDVKPGSGNKDPTLSIVVSDPSVYKGAGADAEDLVITIFRKKAADLPTALQRGMPVLIRDMKVGKFNDKVKGNIYSAGGSWAHLEENKVKSSGGLHPALEKPEIDRLAELQAWWISTTGEQPQAGGTTQAHGANSGGNSKMVSLGQVQPNMFFSAVFKILHIEQGRSVHYELYVTDGTLSPLPLRNWHKASHPDIPPAGIFCLHIADEPEEHDKDRYKFGNFLMLSNLRSKMWQGEMEIIWSDKLLEGQAAQGWKKKRAHWVDKEDERALEIEKRLSELQRRQRDGTDRNASARHHDGHGEYIRDHAEATLGDTDVRPSAPLAAGPFIADAQTVQPAMLPVITAAAPTDVPTSHHLFTTLTDPIEHPMSTIADVLTNRTFPNKFRIKARVKDIHSRGIPGNDHYVQKHCGHCKRAIVRHDFCHSCQDMQMAKAAWRYRFAVILEDEHHTLPILICDDEAEHFLPPLPPLSPSSNPNDHKKNARQIAATTKKVVEILQGGAMDSIRPRPWIDWTLQSMVVSTPKGYVGKGEKGIVVYKAFGMTSV